MKKTSVPLNKSTSTKKVNNIQPPPLDISDKGLRNENDEDKEEEVAIDPYTLRKLEIIEEIKELYVAQSGKMKFDTNNSLIEKLFQFNLEELENILFNNKTANSITVNRKLVERIYDGTSSLLSTFLNDEILKEDFNNDTELKEATEIVVGKRIGYLPDEAKVVILSSNHIVNSLKRKASQKIDQMRDSKKKNTTNNNNDITNKSN